MRRRGQGSALNGYEARRVPTDKLLTLRGAQVLGKEGEFVQDFRERGELIALEDFVEYFRAGGRIVDSMYVVIGIIVKVVIFQEDVSTRDDAYVAVEEAADVHAAAIVVTRIEALRNF